MNQYERAVEMVLAVYANSVPPLDKARLEGVASYALLAPLRLPLAKGRRCADSTRVDDLASDPIDINTCYVSGYGIHQRPTSTQTPDNIDFVEVENANMPFSAC